MSTSYEVRYASSPKAVKKYDTSELREEFLVQDLLKADQVKMVYSHYDRFIVAGAVPVKGALELETIEPLKSSYFLERRELGIVNVGGKGKVTVDGTVYELDYKEALYLGKAIKKLFSKAMMQKNHFILYELYSGTHCFSK